MKTDHRGIINSNLWPPRSMSTTCHTGTMYSVVEKSIHCVTVQFILSTIHHPTLVLIFFYIWGSIRGTWFLSCFTSLWNQYGVELKNSRIKNVTTDSQTVTRHWFIAEQVAPIALRTEKNTGHLADSHKRGFKGLCVTSVFDLCVFVMWTRITWS